MAIRIVNREREIQRLRELAAQPPALAIVRGRRRVGKTFLLRAALSGERVVHFQAEDQPRALQLDAFARECSRIIPGAPPVAFVGWGDALDFLEREAITSGPLVVVLDEMQYLAATDPALPSAIQRRWDRWDRDEVPLMLVLCGSALAFMAGVLGGDKPLHGRSVYRPLILPLTYREASELASPTLPADGLIERFAVLGGTPQYQRWAGAVPLNELIARNILPPDAALHSEPEHLVREEEGIREPGPYMGALQAIAFGDTTTTAIAGRLQVKQQLASQFLTRLETLGYIAKFIPIEVGGRGRRRGYWRIADPYVRFWFRYVLPNRSRLARGRIDEVATEIDRDLATFVGPAFEDCCRVWVGRYSAVGAGAIEVGSWWSRRGDVEIDVVTLDKTGYSLLGSCKWRAKQVGTTVLDDLYRARATLGPAAARARLALFARRGFTDSLRDRAQREDVLLVTAADLFEP